MRRKRTGPRIRLEDPIELDDPDLTGSDARPESMTSREETKRLTKTDVETAWDAFARQLIKETLVDAGLGYGDLTQQLAELGLPLTQAVVCRRVNRGHFSGGFFLLCMQALQATRIDFEGERRGVVRIDPAVTDSGTSTGANPKRNELSMDDMAMRWGIKAAAPRQNSKKKKR